MDRSFFTGLSNRVIEMPAIWMILWLGLAVLSIGLLVLMRTRWGQSQPLRKCAVLSLLVHVLLACFATTVHIVTGVGGSPEPPSIRVAILDNDESRDDRTGETRPAEPWDSLTSSPVLEPMIAELARSDENEDVIVDRQTVPEAMPLPEEIAAAAEDRQGSEVSDTAAREEAATSPTDLAAAAERIEAPSAERQQSPKPILPTPALRRADAAAPAAMAERSIEEMSPITPGSDLQWTQLAVAATSDGSELPTRMLRPAASEPIVTDEAHDGDRAAADVVASGRPAARIYQNRTAPERARVAERYGGSRATEASVNAALEWLVAAQHTSGGWQAVAHGAGTERVVLGHDRRGAGAQADTGVTGLALLALLGAGQTHTTGRHQATVRRGLSYLVQAQGADGNLAGRASLFARMYCHGIATFALSEAYAMTGDRRLEPAVRRAIGYTLASQHPVTGGWRYQPGDPGDTSQHGWQVMALKSAELAGVEVPSEAYRRASRFLQGVASGARRGIASYRPGAGPSRTMTAEALVCRQLLGAGPIVGRDDRPAGDESAAYMLQELPSGDRPNLYYWYYATLGLYQHQGPSWQRWNAALKQTLVDAQITEGRQAGSWDPDTVWGGYGGRVYSTAMAALCLEVYYRYLPLYEETARRRALIK